jgi:hypothetical protein
MNAQLKAVEIASQPGFSGNAAAEVAAATGRAADAETGTGMRRSTTLARYWTHVACWLVSISGNPNVIRGTILDGLVERYGSGNGGGS